MLVLKDGNIVVYNLQRRSSAPVFLSGPRTGKHRETVWQVNTVRVTLYYTVKRSQIRFIGLIESDRMLDMP